LVRGLQGEVAYHIPARRRRAGRLHGDFRYRRQKRPASRSTLDRVKIGFDDADEVYKGIAGSLISE
jgi:hypothetical protein